MSKFTDMYLNENSERGAGEGKTPSSFLAAHLTGKAKKYSGGYLVALKKDLAKMVAAGTVTEGPSAGGKIAYYRTEVAA